MTAMERLLRAFLMIRGSSGLVVVVSTNGWRISFCSSSGESSKLIAFRTWFELDPSERRFK